MSDQTGKEPDRTPRPNAIVDAPATVAACAADRAGKTDPQNRAGTARADLGGARSHGNAAGGR